MRISCRLLAVCAFVFLFGGLGAVGCGGDDPDPQPPVDSSAFLGTWDMNLAETHPDIFVPAGGMIRTVEDVEWAYLQIVNHGWATGFVKLKESDTVLDGSKGYEIIDGKYLHVFNVAYGLDDTFEFRFENNLNKLVFIILERGLDPDYPNGVYEVYDRRR
jgi:hypothetical protein